MEGSPICEPHFSFIQLLHSGEERNTNQILFGNEIANSDLPTAEINDYLHYCSLGSGHTGAYTKLSHQAGHRDNQKNDYECAWWERKVKLDGGFYHPDLRVVNYFGGPYSFEDTSFAKIRTNQRLAETYRKESMEAAIQYANRVAIGTLPQLRNFLETSIKKSNRVSSYFYNFPSMLNEKGKQDYENRLKKILGKKTIFQEFDHFAQCSKRGESVTKTMLGMTRRRQFLIPEWADDDALWAKN